MFLVYACGVRVIPIYFLRCKKTQRAQSNVRTSATLCVLCGQESIIVCWKAGRFSQME